MLALQSSSRQRQLATRRGTTPDADSAILTRQPTGRTICGVPNTFDESDSATRAAEALRRRAADWAAGAEEGRELDRRIARSLSPQERLDGGSALAELAAKLRRPE